MSGYDNPPIQTTHNFGSLSFASTPAASAIRRPRGKRFCRIVEVQLACSVLFTAVTTPGYIRVGTASSAAKFAELNLATVAATDCIGTVDYGDLGSATSVIKAAGQVIDMDKDGDAGAAMNQLEVAFIAPTGGTPAGTGIPTIVCEWW